MNTDDLIIDCFAGGGGASTGIEAALGRPIDIAVNHDPDAILMHKTNHPNTLHLTEDIFKVDLLTLNQSSERLKKAYLIMMPPVPTLCPVAPYLCTTAKPLSYAVVWLRGRSYLLL